MSLFGLHKLHRGPNKHACKLQERTNLYIGSFKWIGTQQTPSDACKLQLGMNDLDLIQAGQKYIRGESYVFKFVKKSKKWYEFSSCTLLIKALNYVREYGTPYSTLCTTAQLN